jgi:spermidine synthase
VARAPCYDLPLVEESILSSPRLRAARLAILGAASAAFQTLFFREFFASFGGNEAVLASVLGPWLLLTALGAWLGRHGSRAPSRVAGALFAYGLLSAASLTAARALPGLFPATAAPGAATALGLAFVLLAPSCLVSGLAFSWLAAEDREAPGPGRAYLAESVGAALAGALLSLLLLGQVPAFALQGLFWAAVALAAALGLARRVAILVGGLGAALGIAFALLPVGDWALAAQGAHLEGATEQESAFASIVVSRQGGQTTVYADRQPLATQSEPEAAEEAAHLPLALHPGPRTVAVIGVAPTGTVAEILRHGVERIHYVLEDPVLAEVLRAEFADLRAPAVEAVTEDARRFLRGRPGAFDAILSFSPEPTSAQLNRVFTTEFFALARRALRPQGLLSVSLGGHAQFAAPEKRRLHSSVRRTLAAVLGEVAVLPAARTYYLTGKDLALPRAPEIPGAIGAALSARRIAPVHLTAAHLAHQLSERRLDEALRWSALVERPNTDLYPTTYRLALDGVLAEYADLGVSALVALAVALVLGALMVFGPRSRPLEFAVLTSGATSLASQLVLALAYQIAAGALYREMGLFLAGFMAGAAAGAFWATRARLSVLFLDLGQVGLPLLVFALLPWAVAAGPWARGVVFAATVLVGFLPGAQFAAVRGVSAGALYTADLAGATVAALVTFTVVVPVLGLRDTFLLLAGLKVLSSVALALPARTVPAGEAWPPLAPIVPLALVAMVLVAAGESTHVPLYAFTFWRPYQGALVLALFFVLIAAFEPEQLREALADLGRRTARLRERLGISGSRLLYFGLLLPVAAFPLARCYFSVPFLFCHVCPRQCVFGVLRPYVIPAALLANFYDRRFCERVCPLGTTQVACENLRRRRARRVKLLQILRFLALGFVILAYFLAERGHGQGIEGTRFFAYFYKNGFTPSFWVLTVAAGLLLASFLVRRPFCEGLCPVGAVSSLVERISRGRAT